MPTTREVLDATIALEKQSMALYGRFAKIFASEPGLQAFWFEMARDEARHVGALPEVRFQGEACRSSEPIGQVGTGIKRGSGPSELNLWLRNVGRGQVVETFVVAARVVVVDELGQARFEPGRPKRTPNPYDSAARY